MYEDFLSMVCDDFDIAKKERKLISLDKPGLLKTLRVSSHDKMVTHDSVNVIPNTQK